MSTLYEELMKAHAIAATANMNGSLAVALTVYQASGSMTQALAAASLAQGALHAPIEAARELLRHETVEHRSATKQVYYMLRAGLKVPGFGNSFYKPAQGYDNGDPAFFTVHRMLPSELLQIVQDIRVANPKLPPANAAMYTAMVMEALDMPVGMGPAVFIAARVQAWAAYLLAQSA